MFVFAPYCCRMGPNKALLEKKNYEMKKSHTLVAILNSLQSYFCVCPLVILGYRSPFFTHPLIRMQVKNGNTFNQRIRDPLTWRLPKVSS